MKIPAPFAEYECVVPPEWIDYNGHMNVGYYLLPFEQAAKPFFKWLDLSARYREESGCTTYAAEAHLTFEREVIEGDRLRFETYLLAYRAKVIDAIHLMYHADEGYLAATNEVVYVHVDSQSKSARPFSDRHLQLLDKVTKTHAELPRPSQAGRAIKVVTR